MFFNLGRVLFYMNLTSKDNPTVKWAARLSASAKARKEEGLFVAEGLRLCRDVVQNGGTIHTAFMLPAFAEEDPETAAAIEQSAARTFWVGDAVMKKLSDTTTPQGVLCLCKTPEFGGLPTRVGRYIMVENLADPGNLGTVARTAEALGLDGLLVAGGCDVYQPKALRASMGALLRLPVYTGTADALLSAMHSLGIPSYAAVVKNADCRLGQIAFENCVVVIGNEANGITPETAALCHKTITIPMAGRAESLNASMAAGIVMWEMTRPRG